MEGPVLAGGTWVWRDHQGKAEVLFAGRGPGLGEDRDQVLQRLAPGSPPVAWARQVHSATVLPALPGLCGEGDALVSRDASRDSGLALSVVTADCVPVLLAGPGGLAAVHAGWRGIVGGVVGATLAELERTADPSPPSPLPPPPAGRERGPGGEGLHRWTAWVGPAIGPCCYEVGEDVAAQVAAASGPEAVVPGKGDRPHLDLAAAVRRQLADAGVGDVRVLAHCTRCDAERLWSYRREGKRAGRNLAFIWRRS